MCNQRPFLIKKFPCDTLVLRASNAYCAKAQKLLGMSQGRIASQLTKEHVSLFVIIDREIMYLEYEDEPLAVRAARLGRDLACDLIGAYTFKSELFVKKGGMVYHLKGYKSYSEAGRQLGLSTQPEINGFCQVATGKKKSSNGWRLVYK